MIEYDPFDDVMKVDPFPVYARLRAESPVHYVEAYDTWALALFEDIWNAGQDSELYPSPGPTLGTIITIDEATDAPAPESVFGLNPPYHTQIRKAVTRLYSPRGVAKLESHIRGTVKRCLDEALPTGRLDVIADLGLHVSVEVASLLIGLPLEDSDHLVSIVRRFFTRIPGVDGMPPDAIAASMELNDYLLAAVKKRRKAGGFGEGKDALDLYAAVAPPDGSMTDERLASHMHILVVGGTETLPKVFAGGLIQLHRHPDQRAELVADPSLIPSAFQEIARYEMPTQFLTRGVSRDHELRGQALKKGQGVMFLYRSANRDANEFEDPDRFDIHRKAPWILSFGHGTHVCLGQHAAKLEAKVLYEELLSVVPEYDLDESEVVPERSEFVAGYVSVPIRFRPSA